MDARPEFPAAVLGVSKWYLAQYQAVFQWGFNIKAVTHEFLRILLGRPPSTDLAP